jgi:ribosomal protein L11 methyltransferase
MTEWTIEQKPEKASYLCGYFQDASHITPAWKFLCRRISCLQHYTPTQEMLPDTDWKNHYKEFLKPFRTGPLHIVPEWMRKEYKIPSGHHGIYLDAGLAFGTGAHETTQLCLTRLVEFTQFHPDHLDTLRCIDVGCGSGILSIAAHKLGFRNIFGCDTDPHAIAVSQENAQLNAVPDSAIDFQIADMAYALLGKQADLISANILMPVLKQNANLLIRTLSPKGTVSLSGILNAEAAELQSTFDPLVKRYWTTHFHHSLRSLGEWTEIAYSRKQT